MSTSPTGSLKYGNLKAVMVATGDLPSSFGTQGLITSMRLNDTASAAKAVIREGGAGGTIILTLKSFESSIHPVDESLISFRYTKQLHATITGVTPELSIYAP